MKLVADSFSAFGKKTHPTPLKWRTAGLTEGKKLLFLLSFLSQCDSFFILTQSQFDKIGHGRNISFMSLFAKPRICISTAASTFHPDQTTTQKYSCTEFKTTNDESLPSTFVCFVRVCWHQSAVCKFHEADTLQFKSLSVLMNLWKANDATASGGTQHTQGALSLPGLCLSACFLLLDTAQNFDYSWKDSQPGFGFRQNHVQVLTLQMEKFCSDREIDCLNSSAWCCY